MGTDSSSSRKSTPMSLTSSRTSSPSNDDARSPSALCGGTRGPRLTGPAVGLTGPVTTTGDPTAATAEAEAELSLSSKELPSLCEGAPRHSPPEDLTLAYDSEDFERQLGEFFGSPEPELRDSGASPDEILTGWANTEDDADPDHAPATVGGGDIDTPRSTLVGNDEGTRNTTCPAEDGYSVTVFPNGTIMYTPVARPQLGAVRPDADLERPPGAASRIRKRSRKERQEEENDEPEVEVIEVAPKQQRVQAPPLMPKDKFCLVFPQPAGFPWDRYLGVKIESAKFSQEHLPVDSVEEAEKMVKWWRQEWEDNASNLTYLMGLLWKTDPAGSAKRLIREEEVLRSSVFSDVQGCAHNGGSNVAPGGGGRRRSQAPVAASGTQSRKRKSRGDNGEKDAPATPARKKQKKAKAPTEKLGVDGKIVHQRGIVQGAGKLQFETKERREALEALQKRLLGEAAGHR
ncbi:uncharacterized protein DFL_003748 [Arthrobotrys flagrans]|uniref:Uncharacterized protein n=1 Tax=Arthrobotrys flagrans TaxID=97331 RepID=A0A437A2P6_ARTFL|nr:hypothetical protein DFL_003748 [Arthrobotrys flagrans]